mmetsp:Transcript_27887/g.59038  ORF Transcript_27887/g.59038 Transcript_27887/m.59038 type:complete len:226 (-) Transcript_27887:204-881(-)
MPQQPLSALCTHRTPWKSRQRRCLSRRSARGSGTSNRHPRRKTRRAKVSRTRWWTSLPIPSVTWPTTFARRAPWAHSRTPPSTPWTWCSMAWTRSGAGWRGRMRTKRHGSASRWVRSRDRGCNLGPTSPCHREGRRRQPASHRRCSRNRPPIPTPRLSAAVWWGPTTPSRWEASKPRRLLPKRLLPRRRLPHLLHRSRPPWWTCSPWTSLRLRRRPLPPQTSLVI